VSANWLKAEGSRLKGWEAKRLEALEPSSFAASQSYRFLAHQPLSLQLCALSFELFVLTPACPA
jgi:hypothetical protein